MFLGKNLYKVKLNRNPFPSEWASLAIEEESTTGERGEVLPITGLRALREHKSCLEHGTRETRRCLLNNQPDIRILARPL
ncbi:hypothetical protein D5086_021942 [Populus alba]|uniref:Uncharacterized protein n=1 Tax=Populus alba TaxID=43335 RepID=A0ACC4BDK7_POPAL